MARIHTKNGEPLSVSGDYVYAADGHAIGRIRGRKVFGPDGGYVGTLVNGRLIYRSTDSASRGSSFAPRRRLGFSALRALRSARWGEEPKVW